MFILITLLLMFHSPAQAAPRPDATDVYYMVFLRPDPNRQRLPQADMERIQTAHMANINAMAARGVLIAAGPMEDTPPTISGIFVFKVASLDEATRIATQDPTVVEHRNTVDVVAWRGPRGIGEEYARLHREQPDAPVGMGVQPLFLMYRGPATAGRDEALKAHAAYLERLRADGKIGAAGPTEGNNELLSIVVFNRIAEDEAARLIAADPAVKAGALRAEAHRWWCAEHVLPGAGRSASVPRPALPPRP